jgi:hypothetical protein
LGERLYETQDLVVSTRTVSECSGQRRLAELEQSWRRLQLQHHATTAEEAVV